MPNPIGTVLRELGPDPATGQLMVIKDGRWGPYVSDGHVNVSLPGADPVAITAEQAAMLLAVKRDALPRQPRPTAAPVRRPRVRSVTQHSIEGALTAQVTAPEVYVGNADIHFRWGPIFLVLKDKDAARSLLGGLADLAEIVNRIYPDVDAVLAEQRRARAAMLQLPAARNRGYVNGTATDVVHR